MAISAMRSARKSDKRSAAQASIGTVLRDARLRAGRSQAHLAAELGVSQETVSASETGRGPRHSTLMAYLEALPWLSAHDLLPQPALPRAASPAAWRRLHEVFGFAARSCRVEFSSVPSGLARTVRLEGVAARESKPSPELVAALMRAVGCADGTSLLGIEIADPFPTERRPLRLVDARGTHRFWTRAVRDAVEVCYEMQGPADALEPTAHSLDYLTETLELVMVGRRRSKAPGARAWVRPETIPRSDALPNLVRLMHPSFAEPRLEKGDVVWRVERPLPGFVYGLDVGDGPPVRAGSRKWTLADTLRSNRAAAGMALRDVAKVAGVCHASVSYAEGGRDPRLGTLRGYMRAIPSLSPQEILPASCASGSLSDAETWDLYRDIYSYEIREIRKTLTIAQDGTSTNVIETLGLRPLRDDVRQMRVRTGLHRAVAQISESVLQEVESDLEDLKVKRISKTDGATVHEFSFSSRLATGSLSHVRRYAGSKYPLHRTASRKRLRDADQLYSGAGLNIYHPVRRATLTVLLPAGHEPPWARAVVFPTCVCPDRDLAPLSEQLPRPPCRVSVSPAGTRLSVTLDLPLLGTSMAITWGVPD